MSTIRCRTIAGPNNEPQWGQGQGNFVTDLDCVAQLVRTRLLLFEGEWWANLLDGLPLWQSILGQGGNSVSQISLLIQQRILATPYVISLNQVQTNYNASTRAYQFSAVVQTQFGSLALTNNVPSPPSTSLPS